METNTEFRNYPLPYSGKEAIKAYKEVYWVKRMTAKHRIMFNDLFQGYFDSEESFCFWLYDELEDIEEIESMRESSHNLKMTVDMHFSYGTYSFQDGYVFGY